jgi:hypothetical protein
MGHLSVVVFPAQRWVQQIGRRIIEQPIAKRCERIVAWLLGLWPVAVLAIVGAPLARERERVIGHGSGFLSRKIPQRLG